MRRFAVPLFALCLLTLLTRADDKPSPAAAKLADLKKSYEDAQKKYVGELREKGGALQKELSEAKSDEEKKEINKKIKALNSGADSPLPAYSLKFLALAQENAKDPVAMDALQEGLRASGGPFVKNSTWPKIMEEIRTKHVTDPKMRGIVRQVSRTFDDDTVKLLQDVAAKHPDRKTQAYAYKGLAAGKDNAANAAQGIQNNKDLRDEIEERLGKEFVTKLLANADTNRKEAEETRKLLKDRYADVFPDLSIGKPAPEVVSKNIEGKEVRLSDLKGKVVVLDIWATWCPPCRAMIPHEREMVEKLKDKPFVLVSISADDKQKTLTDFLVDNKMPWTHWYNGPEGGIVEDWEVNHYPTIYVIDAKGVIRYKEIRGEKLEDAVNELLKEAAAK